MLVKIIVCLFAGLGAGFGTGFAGMSAAAVISPMLITFLGVPAYQAIGIALASDVLASAVSAYTYGKHKNLDILIFSLNATLPIFLTMLLGIKFIVRPVLTTKDAQASKTMRQKLIQSILSGIVVGFICGFIGAGGGMMMLLLLTSVLGYELKTAVGTSVFIMTFTALTGSLSHFAIGGMPDLFLLVLCIVFTFLFARIAAVFANKADPKLLNRLTGVILFLLGAVMLLVK